MNKELIKKIVYFRPLQILFFIFIAYFMINGFTKSLIVKEEAINSFEIISIAKNKKCNKIYVNSEIDEYTGKAYSQEFSNIDRKLVCHNSGNSESIELIYSFNEKSNVDNGYFKDFVGISKFGRKFTDYYEDNYTIKYFNKDMKSIPYNQCVFNNNCILVYSSK